MKRFAVCAALLLLLTVLQGFTSCQNPSGSRPAGTSGAPTLSAASDPSTLPAVTPASGATPSVTPTPVTPTPVSPTIPSASWQTDPPTTPDPTTPDVPTPTPTTPDPTTPDVPTPTPTIPDTPTPTPTIPDTPTPTPTIPDTPTPPDPTTPDPADAFSLHVELPETVEAGDVIKVKVVAQNNPAIAGYSVTMTYDPAAFEIGQVLLHSGQIGTSNKTVAGKVRICGTSMPDVAARDSNTIRYDGEFFTVSFTVKEGAPAGEKTFGLLRDGAEDVLYTYDFETAVSTHVPCELTGGTTVVS